MPKQNAFFKCTFLKGSCFRGFCVLGKQNFHYRAMFFLPEVKWPWQLLFKLFIDRIVIKNTSIKHTSQSGLPDIQLVKMRKRLAVIFAWYRRYINLQVFKENTWNRQAIHQVEFFTVFANFWSWYKYQFGKRKPFGGDWKLQMNSQVYKQQRTKPFKWSHLLKNSANENLREYKVIVMITIWKCKKKPMQCLNISYYKSMKFVLFYHSRNCIGSLSENAFMKINLFTYYFKAIGGFAQSYIASLLNKYHPRRNLHSTSCHQENIYRYPAFSIAAAKLWRYSLQPNVIK